MLKKFFLELFQDNRYKTFSQSKFWSNVANLVATIAFIRHSFLYELDTEMLVGYVAIVGMQRLGAKFLDNRDFYSKREREQQIF